MFFFCNLGTTLWSFLITLKMTVARRGCARFSGVLGPVNNLFLDGKSPAHRRQCNQQTRD
jgi:hypothetical protein